MIIRNPIVALMLLLPVLFFGLAITVFLGGTMVFKGHEEELAQTPAFAYCSLGELNEEVYRSNFDKNVGVFTGKADMFIEAAENNQIDPVLLAAIAWHETGAGKSYAVRNYNNPGGLMNPNGSGLFRYSSLEDGINAMASNLYRLYIAQGLVTIPDIGAKYAPIGAGNDPTGLNNHWVPVVTKLATQFGGLTMNCEDVLDSDGEWGMPVGNNNRITSPFGNRIHPIRGTLSFHKGVDFACNHEESIYSTKDGVVEVASTGWTGGYGNYVLVKHGSMYSAYAHLNSINVSVGDQVKKGERIGGCGTTGSSTGNHLHFEIKKGVSTGYQDPMKYLKGE